MPGAATDFLTVATADYAPLALTTLRSARRQGEHASYHYFVLDARRETLPILRKLLGDDAQWINLFGPYDLVQGREKYLAALSYFDAFELSCFAKYLGIAHVMEMADAAPLCIYADADLFFVDEIGLACQDIGDAAALLTPHHLGPASDKDELEHMALGWINAGFLCVRQGHAQTRSILDWLVDRISRYGFNAPSEGLFVDQTWCSALPFVFPEASRLSRNPGLNVAYWNLEERGIFASNGKFQTRNGPLLFFHFSGFVPDKPRLLSKHADIEVLEKSALAELCAQYRSELARAMAICADAKALPSLAKSAGSLKERMRVGFSLNGTETRLPVSKPSLAERIVRKLRSK